MNDKSYKQTAVEWFFRWVNDNPEATHKEYAEAFEQAKEMEKQQIIDAYATVITKYNGVKSWTKIHDEEAELYYQENYNRQDKTDK